MDEPVGLGAALMTHEAAWRMGIFASVFVLLALWQSWRPYRGVRARGRRWGRHLIIALLGSLLVRLLFPLAAVAVGAWAEGARFGLLQWLPLPTWLVIISSIVLLDLAIYWQHRIFHWLPPLWRLHRMHHSDTQFDVSTAIRFHPLEIALSMLIKMGVVALLGAPAMAVILFEIVLNATALFNHSDLHLPAALDTRLRWLLVTPDMHRIHHSTERVETNSNFGFCLPWWDRLFGSYRSQSLIDQAEMPIGLSEFRSDRDQSLAAQLLQPLR
jgi:sterol desaturase/sphingolipid hydroxylase (fatty acid hydroxylase superfamily)